MPSRTLTVMARGSDLGDWQTPFIKWAGGKRWLVSRHAELFPKSYKRYFEPFLGGAAAYLFLAPSKAILSDANAELIDTYLAIRDEHELVSQKLSEHQKNHSKEYYYAVRDQRPRRLAYKAARFLYLNRTCWNGLYRVNLKGSFNVPIGTKENVLLETDDFEALSTQLRRAEILCTDFEVQIDKACEGDFMFVDPPYTVKHNNNGFLKYNEKIFSWEDQVRLRDALLRAVDRGVQVLATNANHKSVRDLYREFLDLTTVPRSSVLSGNPKYRSKISELVIASRSS